MSPLCHVLIFSSIFKFGITVMEQEFKIQNVSIKKCCPLNQIVESRDNRHCVGYKGMVNFSDIKVFDKVKEDFIETGETVEQLFVLKVETNFENEDRYFHPHDDTKVYLSGNGTINLHNQIYNLSYHHGNQFCIDHNMQNSSEIEQSFWLLEDEEPAASYNNSFKEYFIITAMLISIFFLLLVLLVFMMLPQLRTVGGVIQMSFCASLTTAFILMVTLKILAIKSVDFSAEKCNCFAYVLYYFVLASFFWMNVMSFDIWWCFRNYEPTNHRGKDSTAKWKLLRYRIYGWGAPLMLSICTATINEVKPPGIQLPDLPTEGCFLKGRPLLLYLHMPMLIISVNWVFYILTARIVWKLKRGTNKLRKSGRRQKIQNRFVDYIKLSLVMGVSWVLEVVGSADQESEYWYITDTYNVVVGQCFFIIFVCNKKVWKLLRRKFSYKPADNDALSSQSRNKGRTESATDTFASTSYLSLNPVGQKIIITKM